MEKIAKNQTGFTLLEILVAITIFTITLMAIIPLLGTAVNVTSGTSLKSKAQILGAEKLDELKSLSEYEIETLIGDDVVGGNTTYSGSDSVLEGGITINRDWVIQEANFGGSNAPSYIITVTVTYTQKGNTVARTFSTIWEH